MGNAGQRVGIKQVDDRLWLASFMHYDPGYFDEDACRLEPIANPFGAKVLPMSPVQTSPVCPEWTNAGWLGRQDSNLGSRDQNPLP